MTCLCKIIFSCLFSDFHSCFLDPPCRKVALYVVPQPWTKIVHRSYRRPRDLEPCRKRSFHSRGPSRKPILCWSRTGRSTDWSNRIKDGRTSIFGDGRIVNSQPKSLQLQGQLLCRECQKQSSFRINKNSKQSTQLAR